MENAVETLGKIRESAQKNKKADDQRFAYLDEGDFIRQGDVYLFRLDKLPEGVKPTECKDGQLAPGTTQGSRHIITTGLSSCKFYTIENETPLDGPAFEAKEEFNLTHPEHGNFTMPAGCYQVRYQRMRADDVRRVQD